MAHVDSQGWIVPDPGDTLRVQRFPRKTDYGALQTPSGKPSILIWHATGVLLSEGVDAADKDGTLSIAKRVAAGAKYYAHGVLSRDGLFAQNVPVNRSVIACEGTYKAGAPSGIQGKENNRVAFQVELANLGWARKDGYFPSSKDKPLKISTSRSDIKLVGALYWQIPTLAQMKAAAEIARAVVDYSGMDPVHALHGHKELGSGQHSDPGALIEAALDVIVRPKLGLVPKLASALFPFGTAAAEAAVQTVTQARRHPLATLGVAAALLGGGLLVLRILRRRQPRRVAIVSQPPAAPPPPPLSCGCLAQLDRPRGRRVR